MAAGPPTTPQQHSARQTATSPYPAVPKQANESTDGQKVQCYSCGQTGHTRRFCPQRRRARARRRKPARQYSDPWLLGKRLGPARLASTVLGGSPGHSEKDRGDHIGAIATIVSPTDPVRDLTAGPLPDYTASALIDTGAMHNFISRQVVKKAGLKPIKWLSSAES